MRTVLEAPPRSPTEVAEARLMTGFAFRDTEYW